jgi:hypothetical protein
MATVVGGLLVFCVPQGASAETSDPPATCESTADHSADHSAGACGAHAHESQDDGYDGGEVLF